MGAMTIWGMASKRDSKRRHPEIQGPSALFEMVWRRRLVVHPPAHVLSGAEGAAGGKEVERHFSNGSHSIWRK
eukprot:4488099-Pyramimonas_sp.AAC.1